MPVNRILLAKFDEHLGATSMVRRIILNWSSEKQSVRK
jgi:hypothetical protein